MRGTYIGPRQELKGKTADLLIADGVREFEALTGIYTYDPPVDSVKSASSVPPKGTVMAQFDDVRTGLGFGMHAFSEGDFEIHGDPFALGKAPKPCSI